MHVQHVPHTEAAPAEKLCYMPTIPGVCEWHGLELHG